ncbi:MAG: HNH endonuclease [Treponema sp.]|nr:HNH endonuclease [Treponema sp.]
MKWVILKGFSRYEISDIGLVKYRDTGKLCPDYDDGKNGYRKIKIYPDGSKKRKSFWVNRLVYQAFRGPIPPKMEIDHLDGIYLNNNIENLMQVTHKQNCALKKQRENNLFKRKVSRKSYEATDGLNT